MYDDEQVNSLAVLSVMPFTGIFLTLLALIFCFFIFSELLLQF